MGLLCLSILTSFISIVKTACRHYLIPTFLQNNNCASYYDLIFNLDGPTKLVFFGLRGIPDTTEIPTVAVKVPGTAESRTGSANCQTANMCHGWGSNSRPSEYKKSALPLTSRPERCAISRKSGNHRSAALLMLSYESDFTVSFTLIALSSSALKLATRNQSSCYHNFLNGQSFLQNYMEDHC